MKTIIWIFCLIISTALGAFPNAPYVLVLGTAQDAGAPQMGCMSSFCVGAWKDPRKRKMVSSIALVDPATERRWIFDASPDLPAQFQMLKQNTEDYSNRIDGIFLTHAHIGHYTGLMYLGRESLNAKAIPVFALPRMRRMLTENAPWSQLVGLENIKLNHIDTETPVALTDRINVYAFEVPHRDEFSETAGYKIVAGTKSLVFIPDIDKWSKWDIKLADVVAENDFVLIDGTFYADGEIPRPMNEVPHPFVTETVELLKALPGKDKAKVHFTHFNHSNPLIQGNKSKLKEVKSQGFKVAYEGLVLKF